MTGRRRFIAQATAVAIGVGVGIASIPFIRSLSSNAGSVPNQARIRFPKLQPQRPDIMKLLLTSAGIKNASIHDALVELLGKAIPDASALCIPTAGYGYPTGDRPANAWRFISGREPQCPMTELGWKSVGVLELTALPSIGAERWDPLGPGSGRTSGQWRRRHVSLSLDAAVRTRGAAAHARQNRLGGTECRKHGDDTSCRRGIRRIEAVHHR